MKGVPIRIEIGPRDIQKKQAVIVRRDNRKKETVKITGIKAAVERTLKEIQQNLLKKSNEFLQKNIVKVKSAKEVEAAVKNGKAASGFYCGSKQCDEKLQKTEAKSLAIQLKGKKGKCIVCHKESNVAYFGKSY